MSCATTVLIEVAATFMLGLRFECLGQLHIGQIVQIDDVYIYDAKRIDSSACRCPLPAKVRLKQVRTATQAVEFVGPPLHHRHALVPVLAARVGPPNLLEEAGDLGGQWHAPWRRL